MRVDVLDLSLALDESVLPPSGPSRVHLVAEILAQMPGIEVGDVELRYQEGGR